MANEILNSLLKEYQQKKMNAELDLERRKQLLYKLIPRLEEIDNDMEDNKAVDEDTIFPACSISKFVTAFCIMRLNEQGLIDIDQPVNDYLKDWKLLTSEGGESGAPIRTLLNHTAGIFDGEDAFYGLRRSDTSVSLLDILEGRTSYNNRPARAENTSEMNFEYSDNNYIISPKLATLFICQRIYPLLCSNPYSIAFRKNPIDLELLYIASYRLLHLVCSFCNLIQIQIQKTPVLCM